MDKLAEKYINDHKNPVTKLELGRKLFLTSNPEEDLVTKRLNVLENILKHDNVERRCARAVAEFIDEKHEILVKKVSSSILQFGYQNKNGIFLFPEEALFLLESNRLELRYQENVLTISEAYEILLQSKDTTISKYLAYKTLASQGYRLVRKSQFDRLNKSCSSADPETSTKCSEGTKLQPSSQHVGVEAYVPENIGDIERRKRKCLSLQQNNGQGKRIKLCKDSANAANEQQHPGWSYEMFGKDDSNDVEKFNTDKTSDKTSETIKAIFDKIREKGAKYLKYKPEHCNPDYYIFLPTNTSKIKPDFRLFFSDQEVTNIQNYCEDSPNIYAVCSGKSVAFYSFCNVELPNL